MVAASHEEKVALINDILSVINNAEKASLKAIMTFAPYVNEKGRALPFLCKNTSDFLLPVEADEYEAFLTNLETRLYPAYFTPKMDFTKAVSVICNSISNGNFVTFDFANFIVKKHENDIDNSRLIDTLSKSPLQLKSKTDFSALIKTKGDASYYAYQLYLSLKKKVGQRSKTLSH